MYNNIVKAIYVVYLRMLDFKEGIKMYDPRQWSFVTDMNYSGSVTISDVWLWFKWLYFYPGDGLVYFLVNGAPKIGQFLEITYSSYGGVLSGVVSFIVWIIALGILGAIQDA